VQYEKEEFMRIREQKKEIPDLTHVVRHATQNTQSENSYGILLHGSYNNVFCYECDGLAHNSLIEHSKYVCFTSNSSDNYDCNDVGRSSLSIEVQCGESRYGYFSDMLIGGEMLLYSHYCFSCSYLFGCV